MSLLTNAIIGLWAIWVGFQNEDVLVFERTDRKMTWATMPTKGKIQSRLWRRHRPIYVGRRW